MVDTIIEKQQKPRKMHPNSLKNLTNGFKKGQSGNPNGKPKKEVCVTSWLKEYADTNSHENIDVTKLTYAQAAALSAWKKAARGDLAQYNFIIDRIEGKVKEKHDISMSGELKQSNDITINQSAIIASLAVLRDAGAVRLGEPILSNN